MSKETSLKLPIAVVVSLAIFVIAGFITQYNIVDSKIADAKEDLNSKNTELVQRAAILEADSKTVKDDIKEIKADVKTLLKLQK